jgi:hypothetical protein
MSSDGRDWTERDERNAMRFGVCESHPDTPRQLRISRISGTHGESVQLLDLTCPLCQQIAVETKR